MCRVKIKLRAYYVAVHDLGAHLCYIASAAHYLLTQSMGHLVYQSAFPRFLIYPKHHLSENKDEDF